MPEAKPAAGGSSDDSKLIGALCYIIGILVPLFVLLTDKKSDKFLVFHAWQSLLLSVVFIVLWGGLTAVTFVASFTGIGALIACLFAPLGLVMLLAVLVLAYKAYQGEKYKIPVLGDFAEKQVK